MAEVQDIFRKYSDSYTKTHKLPLNILKTIGDISSSRTAELGGHVDECDECGHIRISYNSAYLGPKPNELSSYSLYCPSGGLSQDDSKWVSSRKKLFIPVKVLSSKFMYYFKQFFMRIKYCSPMKTRN